MKIRETAHLMKKSNRYVHVTYPYLSPNSPILIVDTYPQVSVFFGISYLSIYRNIKLFHNQPLLLLLPAFLHMYQRPFSSPCSSPSLSPLPCITHPFFLIYHYWSRQGLERKRRQITWLEKSFYSPSLPNFVRASKPSYYITPVLSAE